MTDFLLFDPLEFHTVLNKIRYALIAYQVVHNSTLIANLMQITHRYLINIVIVDISLTQDDNTLDTTSWL